MASNLLSPASPPQCCDYRCLSACPTWTSYNSNLAYTYCMCGVHLHALMCAHTCEGQRSTQAVFLSYFPPYFWHRVTLWTGTHQFSKDRGSATSGIHLHVCVPKAGITDVCCCTQVFMWCWGSKLKSSYLHSNLPTTILWIFFFF